MRRFRRTTLITVFCLAVLCGLGAARKVNFYPSIWMVLLAPILLFVKRKNILSLIIILVFGGGIGLWRGGMYMHNVHQLKSLTERKITIIATATSDSIYGKRSQIQFTGSNIQMIYPYQSKLAGSFKLSGFGEQMIYRGDKVEVSGKLFPSRGSN